MFDPDDFSRSEAKRREALASIRRITEHKASGDTDQMKAEVSNAWRLLEEALAICPQNHRARFLLVSCCMNDDNYVRAREEAQIIYKALTEEQMKEMNDPLLHLSLVHACKMTGDTESAMKYAKEGARIYDDDPQAHMALGELLELVGDYKGASEACHASLNISEQADVKVPLSRQNKVFVLCCLSSSMVQQGEAPQAEKFAKQAVEIDSAMVLPLLRLAEVQHYKGQHVEAMATARHAETLDPSDAEVRKMLAVIQAKLSPEESEKCDAQAAKDCVPPPSTVLVPLTPKDDKEGSEEGLERGPGADRRTTKADEGGGDCWATCCLGTRQAG